MACSCNSNPNLNIQIPLSHKIENIKVKRPALEDFDFSSTTRPCEVCYRCACKHIGLAISFFETGGKFEKLVACGEIALAGMHYSFQDRDIKNFYYYTAVQLLKKSEITEEDFKPLLAQALSPDKCIVKVDFVFPFNVKPFVFDQIKDEDKPYMILLYILSAYCMLFTELTYEDINKVYAVGSLSTAALKLRRMGLMDWVVRVRKVWKLAQEIDDTTIYDICELAIENLIQDYWSSIQTN